MRVYVSNDDLHRPSNTFSRTPDNVNSRVKFQWKDERFTPVRDNQASTQQFRIPNKNPMRLSYFLKDQKVMKQSRIQPNFDIEIGQLKQKHAKQIKNFNAVPLVESKLGK